MYVYCVATPEYLKIGRWSGSVSALWTRYGTYIPAFDLTLFQMEDAIIAEKQIHRACAAHHMTKELFTLTALPIFMQFASSIGLDHCTSTDLQKRCMVITRRRLTILEKDHGKALCKIKNLEEELQQQKKDRVLATGEIRTLTAELQQLKTLAAVAASAPTENVEKPIESFLDEQLQERRNRRIHIHLLKEKYDAWCVAKGFSEHETSMTVNSLTKYCRMKFKTVEKRSRAPCCSSSLPTLYHWMVVE
jgi:hypothetical protein